MPEYGSVFVCLMGMGTVFFGLICLIVLTTIMGKIVGGRPAPAAPARAASIEALTAMRLVEEEMLRMSLVKALICSTFLLF